MLFNSLEYLLFLPVTIVIFYLLPRQRWREVFLLGSSYFFYISWNPVYIILILLSTVVDYLVSHYLDKPLFSENSKIRGKLVLISMIFNLGLLCFFKYVDFFIINFNSLLELIGVQRRYSQFNLLLPVGISFYTLQTIGYTIDVFYKRIKPERDFISFALYVSFFPQLVAGPIERAKNLIHQLKQYQIFDISNIIIGLRLILWGIFKKVVIADNLAPIVDQIYDGDQSNGVIYLIGTIFFAFQIFCDFSGYTDIAVGSARCLGVKLMENFRRPYSSLSITEIWKRWHISLSTWINDYLFNMISFKLRKLNNIGITLSLFITFTIIGFWHGAAWTFIIFGFSHGLALSMEFLSKKKRRNLKKRIPDTIFNFGAWIYMFSFWLFTIVIFRSSDMSQVWNIYQLIFHDVISFLLIDSSELIYNIDLLSIIFGFSLIGLLEIIQYLMRENSFDDFVNTISSLKRWSLYSFLILCILSVGAFNNQSFIYFAF